MSLTVRNVQVDVPDADHDAVLAFWAAALGATPRRASGPHTHLVEPASVCGVHVQRREDGASRLHLDLDSTDVEADVARLVAAGGAQTGERPQGDGLVVASPAGLLVCVIEAGRIVPELAPAARDGARLEAVFADVPAEALDAEVAFWTAAFETTAEVSNQRDEYVLLDHEDAVGGPIAFEVQRVGAREPRFHLDLAADDVAAEAARLEGLGASRVAEIATWVVLADPADNLLCVVPADAFDLPGAAGSAS